MMPPRMGPPIKAAFLPEDTPECASSCCAPAAAAEAEAEEEEDKIDSVELLEKVEDVTCTELEEEELDEVVVVIDALKEDEELEETLDAVVTAEALLLVCTLTASPKMVTASAAN
jgi:hypothetical protein